MIFQTTQDTLWRLAGRYAFITRDAW